MHDATKRQVEQQIQKVLRAKGIAQATVTLHPQGISICVLMPPPKPKSRP